MMYICSWCGGVIKDDGKELANNIRISHGLCAACEKLTDAERDKIAEDKSRQRQEKQKNDTKTV